MMVSQWLRRCLCISWLLAVAVVLRSACRDDIDDLITQFAGAMQRLEGRRERLTELGESCPKRCKCGTLAQHLRALRRDRPEERFGEPPFGAVDEGRYVTTFYPPATFWGCEWVVDCEQPHVGHQLRELPKIDGDCVELYGQSGVGRALRLPGSHSDAATLFRVQLNTSRLRVLDASGLGLGSLPHDTFRGWTSLRFLALESNGLRALPASLFFGSGGFADA